jgi:hypothetical protein
MRGIFWDYLEDVLMVLIVVIVVGVAYLLAAYFFIFAVPL